MQGGVEERTDEPLSVSAALALAKRSLESFTVKLIGEVSEVSNKPGYKAVYFSVKDSGASMPCMMWLNRYKAAGVELRVGMLVELTGRFTLYAPKGRMNFDVFGLSIAGEGNLRLQVANLAKKLEAEGLMRPERKKQIPRLPEKVGLVTSPRGAAVHDVLRTLRRRFPLATVLLAGVAVEGESAPLGLIAGLEAVRDAGAEVVLLVRGGGSFEDLMPFNDEGLARAIATLGVPVVTGIGHEPDTSIADMVADVRASTPTAAAEAVSPSLEGLESELGVRGAALSGALSRRIERAFSVVERIAERPVFADPNMLFAVEAQSLDLFEDRLQRAIPLNLERDRVKLRHLEDQVRSVGATLLPRFENQLAMGASRLHDLSPLTILSRGYAIAKDEEGSIVKSVDGIEANEAVCVEVADGRLDCTVNAVHKITIETISFGGDDER
ncbi:exodeoxyribonuclease VII large subunit [Raoultibacter massiliensis]|uniref:Exodeoxyribonuclease 7 large subunit n=1 Tax=Raoultibacter massiliensis TaxID=1852371 RepID=A0ABV1JAW5_9ACTN|nr:exodeoxyribonuclease VII large subunit [Raoultibacter massiliensis]